MTRHAKNATANPVYSRHEKNKDTKTSGYGSQKVRLGKDSVKDFDCCSLTLQPCREPVITPDGFLYDKEAILECILHQKTEMARKMKEYEKQKKKLLAEESEKISEKEKSKLASFLEMERRITTKPSKAFTATKTTAESSTATVSLDDAKPSTSQGSIIDYKNLPSFWVPSLTPEAKPTLVTKPDNKTYCPMSKKPIKIKDLIPVKFTRANDSEQDASKALVAKEVRYKCAVTGDTLGNSVPCAVLRNTGHVVTLDCVEKIIKKDMFCPFTSVKLKEKDIIPMQRGGTGFAATGTKLEAKKDRPVMQA
ncbi:predicted protein [Nematostella vectensis]|uniref:U-box domain-containing protein n=1 Tax=Nematostella vectensis TaxID=45351 RepID=A7S885_NEMVE|nr:nitric oxide synthase-interacting protein [Nematostella vectensis]EDO40060.1 predicted protein [Nematostella vectensis]|eukprot:XP_001632123.1 predicted protein [Nematostella vectensis]